jgi:hypothetical protein
MFLLPPRGGGGEGGWGEGRGRHLLLPQDAGGGMQGRVQTSYAAAGTDGGTEHPGHGSGFFRIEEVLKQIDRVVVPLAGLGMTPAFTRTSPVQEARLSAILCDPHYVLAWNGMKLTAGTFPTGLSRKAPIFI